MVKCTARDFDLSKQDPNKICKPLKDGPGLEKKTQFVLHPDKNIDCPEEAEQKLKTAVTWCEKRQGGGYHIRDFDQKLPGAYFNRERNLKLTMEANVVTIVTVPHNLPVVLETIEKVDKVAPRWRISIERTEKGHFWASYQNIVGKAPYYTVTWPKDVEWKIPVAGKVEAGVKGIKFWPQGVTPPPEDPNPPPPPPNPPPPNPPPGPNPWWDDPPGPNPWWEDPWEDPFSDEDIFNSFRRAMFTLGALLAAWMSYVYNRAR